MMRKLILFIFCLFFFFIKESYSQSKIIDEIVATIGDKKILYSDIEKQYFQLITEGYEDEEDLRCKILEELLVQNLLINQAAIDSIEVTEDMVDQQLDQRMRYYVNQVGSEKRLEELFKKSIIEMKEDFRSIVRDQLLAQKMRQEITKSIKITPSEVRSFYREIPADSLPYINAQVEISQIVLYPPSGEQSELDVREKLLSLRQRILDGENFATLAVLYSEDPGSSAKGGDIGFAYKSELDPEYAKTAASLKPGQISKIVESTFGYHIIQLVERQGDRLHTRHILMKPKISFEEKLKTKERLDSILTLIHGDSIDFKEAVLRYSMDEDTRLNGGQMVNQETNSSFFELDQFNTKDYTVINNLKPGEVSESYETIDKNGKTIYKAVKLQSRTAPHVANIKDDYSLFKSVALQEKESNMVSNWVKEKIKTTYIKIDDKYKSCDFSIKGWLK